MQIIYSLEWFHCIVVYWMMIDFIMIWCLSDRSDAYNCRCRLPVYFSYFRFQCLINSKSGCKIPIIDQLSPISQLGQLSWKKTQPPLDEEINRYIFLKKVSKRNFILQFDWLFFLSWIFYLTLAVIVQRLF